MTRFYSIDQANARLRDLGPILHKLKADRESVADAQRQLVRFRATNGNRHHAEELKTREDGIRDLVFRMERYVAQIVAWDVTLRDIETGLVDFALLVALAVILPRPRLRARILGKLSRGRYRAPLEDEYTR